MFNSILVPVDISESRLTEQVIPYVQANAAIGNGKIHFLTVVPSFPYYSSLGLAYSVEMPKLLGSNAAVVVRHAKCPVLVVR